MFASIVRQIVEYSEYNDGCVSERCPFDDGLALVFCFYFHFVWFLGLF
jgi:hypothetical protein